MHAVLPAVDVLAVGQGQHDRAADAGLAALGAEARRRADALAAIGVVGRRRHLDLVVGAGAAAEAAGPGRIAAQLLAAEAHRIELLVDLEIGQRETAQRDQVADQVEAVAALDAAARRRAGPLEHHVAAAVVLQARGDGMHRLRPAGRGAVGQRLAQRLPHHVDDLVRHEHGVHGHRRGRPRIDDAALGQADLDVAEGALVARQVGLEERGERHVDRRVGVGDRAVLEAADLCRGAGEVDDQLAVLDRQRDGDPAVDRLEAVVVDRLLGAPGAVREPVDAALEAAVGMVEHGLEEVVGLVGAQLLDQQRQPLGADAGRAQHRVQVAVERLGQARVEQQQLPQVGAHRAALDQLQDGQADALVEDLGGGRVVGAGRAAADIGLVGAVAGEGDQRAADEHRPRDHPVGQVVAARFVGIVEQEHVLRLDAAGEVAQDRAHREAAAAGVDRDAVGLADQRAARVGDEAGEVVALAEDRRARGARHHPAHLVRDVVEPVLHQRQGDGIGRHGNSFSPPHSNGEVAR